MATNDPTDIWAWSYADQKRLAEGSEIQQEIQRQWRAFWRAYQHDFGAADRAINAAVAAAKAADEPRWELMTRHWRLQHWLNDDIARALPEAIDLLSLATDEKVRGVPQRICAYHDVVDCYVSIDAEGYAEDIVANSQEILAQLPQRHSCADCARLHLAHAASARGDQAETDHWAAQAEAHRHDATHAGFTLSLAQAQVALRQWDLALRHYEKARKEAEKADTSRFYLDATIGMARVQARRGQRAAAAELLEAARHSAKYVGNTSRFADLLLVEATFAEVSDHAPLAIEYFTRAAHQYLALSRLRDAADAGLSAAELARAKALGEPEAALNEAARAIGQLPAASKSLRARLAALGRTPTDPGVVSHEIAPGAHDERQRERLALEDALQAHIDGRNTASAAVMLYRLGRWHLAAEAPRAAVEYFIYNAILERLLRLEMDDREDAINALRQLREDLPPQTVALALAATAEAVPPLLQPLTGDISPERWAWLVRAVAAEVEDQGAAVEPEPVADSDQDFNAWLNHLASMTTLVVRQQEHADPAKLEHWASSLDETATEIVADSADQPGSQELLAFVRALAALSRGAAPSAVQPTLATLFSGIVRRIAELAQRPVWQHPGNYPFEFLVEQAAQRAVTGLRGRDPLRASRLENLAIRFELMNLDIRPEEPLQDIADFLDGLAALMRADGQLAAPLDPPLQAPFDRILRAVAEAGQPSA